MAEDNNKCNICCRLQSSYAKDDDESKGFSSSSTALFWVVKGDNKPHVSGSLL